MQYDKNGNKFFGAFGRRRGFIVLTVIVAVVTIAVLIWVSPSLLKKPSVAYTYAERHAADSLVGTVHDVDSLALLQKQLASKDDKLGSITALREWGRALRNENRFDDALQIHSEGLHLAEAIGDTIEWVRALNNIGTVYRRMDALDMAEEYHYNAWVLSQECADTSFAAQKNRVMSLNGLGNIYLKIGNYERADSALRMALNGERQFHSLIGQAMNYANLGAVFEHRGELDSAWTYYRKSMALNAEAGSDLGVSLCYTYFGRLYERVGQYDKALEQFRTAYRMMKNSKDEWHALNSLIALASISHAMANNTQAADYLRKAQKTAEKIKSLDHLSEIHTLYYKYYKELGEYREALAAYEHATALRDSMIDMAKLNGVQNASLKIERSRRLWAVSEAQHRLERERTIRYVGFGIFGAILFLFAGLLVMLLYMIQMRHRNHKELERMSMIRENFFTNITHEFRTPLTVILGLSHDLQNDENCPPSIVDKMEVVERQGQGLLVLINQLLDISKIKSSVGDPDWENGNITVFSIWLWKAITALPTAAASICGLLDDAR
jgi:two-component system sensor histidine kinase ChiS